MKTISKEKLNEIVKNHQHWLNKDCDGWENMRCNLSRIDLSRIDLRGSNLSYSNLFSSNLSFSDLSCSDLRGSNLRDSNLICCNLSHSDLRGSNLSYSDLSCCNLYNVKLDEEEKIRKGIKLSRPIIGWKKCKDNVIVKLEIPRGAIVFSINNNKCRTDKCIVKEIIGSDRAYSTRKFFSYYVGDVIEIFDFNCEYNVECGKGIHFFRTREEAENYY